MNVSEYYLYEIRCGVEALLWLVLCIGVAVVGVLIGHAWLCVPAIIGIIIDFVVWDVRTDRYGKNAAKIESWIRKVTQNSLWEK